MKTFSWFLALAILATLGCSDLTKSHFDRSQQTLNTNVENLSADVGSLGTRLDKVEGEVGMLKEGHQRLAGVAPGEHLTLEEGLRRRELRLKSELETFRDTTVMSVGKLQSNLGDEIRNGVREVLDERERAEKEAAKEAELEAFKAKERQFQEDERLRRLIRGELQSQYGNLDDSVDKLTSAVSTTSGDLKTTIEAEFRKVQHRFDRQETFEARKDVIEQWLKGLAAGFGFRAIEAPLPPTLGVQHYHQRYAWPGCRVEMWCVPRSKVLYWQCFRY